MKKALLTVLSIACLNVGAAFAQTTVMPKFGITSHTMSLGSWESHSPTYNNGWVGGVAYGTQVTDVLSIHPELLLIQKGYAIDARNGNTHTVKNVRFNMVEVPLLFRYTLKASIFRLYFNFGPSVGYYLGGKYSATETSGTSITERRGDFYFRDGDIMGSEDGYYPERRINRVEAGLQFGGGVGLKLGKGTVLLDARYGLGLSNLYREQRYLLNSREASGKNRVWAYTIGYAFPIGD